MSIKNALLSLALPAALALATSPLQAKESEWYFNVANKSSSKITALEVSEDGKTWGGFDIGKGIAPGATVKLIWDASTDNEGCDQSIRAKFADGSVSEASEQNFCENLDDAIEFTD